MVAWALADNAYPRKTVVSIDTLPSSDFIMGGEGPAIRFTRPHDIDADETCGLKPLSSEELDAAYTRAHSFLLKKKDELIGIANWNITEFTPKYSRDDVASAWRDLDKDGEGDDIPLLFRIASTVERSNGCKTDVELSLPLSFGAFDDPTLSKRWTRLFNYPAFAARRFGTISEALFVDGAPPLSDIFYLLQTLSPGMLVLYRVDEIDDVGEIAYYKSFPSSKWMEENQTFLEEVLGKERYGDILTTTISKPNTSKFWAERGGQDEDWDDSETYTNIFGRRCKLAYDYCDSDCGFCGRCTLDE